MKPTKPEAFFCCSGSCDKGPAELDRRTFLKQAGLAASLLWGGSREAMAGPFTREDFNQLVPADKKLNPDWVRSLYERGAPAVYSGEQLKFIGMPIGGQCSGQVYLGGDGKLWLWEIFNQWEKTGGAGYANPPEQHSPFHQSFCLQVGDREYSLDRTGFEEIEFRGEYPIGTVRYQDRDCPVSVELEAFSPFIPLQSDDSGFPAVVCRYQVKNRSQSPVSGSLVGELQNAVCLYSPWAPVKLHNRISYRDGINYLDCNSDRIGIQTGDSDIFEDWSSNWETRWLKAETRYQRETYAAYSSKPFKAERQFINFEFTSLPHSRVLAVQVLQGNRVVREETRPGPAESLQQSMDLFHLLGEELRIAVVIEDTPDNSSLGIGPMEFSDLPPDPTATDSLSDYGTMGLALLGNPAEVQGGEGIGKLGEPLIGKLGRSFTLNPGETAKITFILSWYFPNLHLGFHGRVAQFYPAFDFPGKQGQLNRYYGKLFTSAEDVAATLASRFDELYLGTQTWRDTWYDSTLPYWLLERLHNSISALATNTCLRFEDGRFWGWEGVNCCPGTCTHVYGYTQAIGRLFPEFERILREKVDFGQALDPSGCISFRGGPLPQEAENGWAIDGQCMVILRTLREHQMSADSSFLLRIWPRVKIAVAALLARDMNSDGILDGPQFNTLDSAWYGEIAWTSSLFNAALCAAESMALELGDTSFAQRCRIVLDRGKQRLNRDLFDGEYFINHVDGRHLDTVNSGTGCHIDQMLGQGWAFQVGLGDEFSGEQTRQALQSLWKYNFSPDVGQYRQVYKQGRWFAMPGQAGLLMCTFPRTDWSFEQSSGKIKGKAFTGYLNECMAGFEYQVAGHMIWESLVEEGLAITRAIHDRYDPLERNPYNEIECGDHYSRNMSSYGVFIALCGFRYHGPSGFLAFDPRVTPENFKAAFTTAEGWGSYFQEISADRFLASLELSWGTLILDTLSLVVPDDRSFSKINVVIDSRNVDFKYSTQGSENSIRFGSSVLLQRGQVLKVTLS